MHAAEWTRRIPWSMLAAGGALLAIGCVGIARAEELRAQLGGSGGTTFLRQHVIYSALALGAALTLSAVNYRVLGRYAYAAFIAVIGLLVLVYFFPPINSAHRWIRVGPIGLQPSELAKVALVLALARYLMYRENFRRLAGLALPLAITLVPVLLILKEPDLGTAAVFLPVFATMVFVAGARRRDLIGLAALGLLMLPLLWSQMSVQQRSRVTAMLSQPAPDERPGDNAYQLHQAKRVMALGNTWGSFATGQPVDDPAAYHLPEARSDFLFCVLVERFGLPGAAVVLGLYAWLVWRGMAAAAATREPFGRLVAAGFSALVAVEALVNTGMTVGILPVTGLPLPMVSYGGSGLLAHGIALGLMISVAMRPGYELAAEPFRYRADLTALDRRPRAA